MSTVDDLILDESKLQASASAERGDLFLLTFLSNAERAVESLPEVRSLSFRSLMTLTIILHLCSQLYWRIRQH